MSAFCKQHNSFPRTSFERQRAARCDALGVTTQREPKEQGRRLRSQRNGGGVIALQMGSSSGRAGRFGVTWRVGAGPRPGGAVEITKPRGGGAEGWCVQLSVCGDS